MEQITLQQRISIIQDIATMKQIIGEKQIDSGEFDILMEMSASSLVGVAGMLLLLCEIKTNKRL